MTIKNLSFLAVTISFSHRTKCNFVCLKILLPVKHILFCVFLLSLSIILRFIHDGGCNCSSIVCHCYLMLHYIEGNSCVHSIIINISFFFKTGAVTKIEKNEEISSNSQLKCPIRAFHDGASHRTFIVSSLWKSLPEQNIGETDEGTHFSGCTGKVLHSEKHC